MPDWSRKILSGEEARWLSSVHYAAAIVMALILTFEPCSTPEIVVGTLLGVGSLMLARYWRAQV